jgi:hypothetical protein
MNTDAIPENTQRKGSVDPQSSLHDESAEGVLEEHQNTERIPSSTETSNTVTSAVSSDKTAMPGLRTPLSYYHPLSSISLHFSTTSQRYDPHSSIDFLGVVLASSSKPKRASTGRRDFSTSVLVSDRSIFPQNVSAQIFRPWKSALPKASAGDVVLLRSMSVKGYKTSAKQRKVGLISTEDSAWCVWRFPSGETTPSAETNPAKTSYEAGEEDMTGPPVEIGEEERKEARKLRLWWKEEVRKFPKGDEPADSAAH